MPERQAEPVAVACPLLALPPTLLQPLGIRCLETARRWRRPPRKGAGGCGDRRGRWARGRDDPHAQTILRLAGPRTARTDPQPRIGNPVLPGQNILWRAIPSQDDSQPVRQRLSQGDSRGRDGAFRARGVGCRPCPCASPPTRRVGTGRSRSKQVALGPSRQVGGRRTRLRHRQTDAPAGSLAVLPATLPRCSAHRHPLLAHDRP